MGIKYIVELMPVSLQDAIRHRFPNGSTRVDPQVPISRLILLQSRAVPRDSVASIDALLASSEKLTAEERGFLATTEGLRFLDDQEKVDLVQQVVNQRWVLRVANYLEEGLDYPLGPEVVFAILETCFPNWTASLSETGEFWTRNWLEWTLLGDERALAEISKQIGMRIPTSAEKMLFCLGQTTGFRSRRFVLGGDITMTSWAGVWSLMFQQGIVRPKSHDRFWECFSFHFQVARPGVGRSGKPGAMRVLANRFLDETELHGMSEDDRIKQVRSFRDLVSGFKGRAEKLGFSTVQTRRSDSRLIEDLYFQISLREQRDPFMTDFYGLLPTYVFADPKDYAGYVEWQKTRPAESETSQPPSA